MSKEIKKEEKSIKITVSETVKFEVRGMTLFEVLGILRLYEQRMSIELLSKLENNKP